MRPGLLPHRPLHGSTYENGASMGQDDDDPSSRRPADVYIPRWRSGPAAAWDFAVTSGLRVDSLAASAQDPDAVLTKYADFNVATRTPGHSAKAKALLSSPW